ncbi:Acetyl-CoA:oxalate CoA-transferase [Caprobacter fermentans]|uniref:Acetyl-CoA:oxalate CoA-transferase n=1 Tax=Caproicibacter fermentans TaxID=2576756 RepID=A0A6N8HWM5_9FIRM|nr:CoA transferase [Caproicibacter fermentans]MVB10089.1 Acetyl-CoA:oxalate CoA-transferase [Caproicibacter fermentans]OCN03357.1 carnitine dehydratase [Clostridium sp. W14A]QNK40162.1 CoA transferase [Caproicibacter fermentans]
MEYEGLLKGCKVLDLTRVLAGPYCAMLLADMGADVTKIEIPGKGDDSRANAPMVQSNGLKESAYYMNLNRNKRGMTLNLKSQDGKDIFKQLVKQSDIVLENYRPGVMEHLGLGYDELRQINPGIIYGCVSGFGHYGPYSQRAGYDIVGQAMSGLMSTTGWPGGPPTRTGTAIADVVGGLNCAIGVLAAYSHKLQTGEGEKVDISLVDGMVSALEIINMIYLVQERVPTRIGNRYEAVYPYDTFRAKGEDQYVVIAAGNDKLFGLLAGVMGRPELTEDPRFRTNILRVQNHEALKPIVEAWTAQYTIDEIVDMLLKVGCPAAPINTIDRVVKDPHISGARKMFVECNHPIGKLTITGNQIKLTNHPIEEFRPAPLLGQQTMEILGEKLGLSDSRINELKAKGAL